MFKKQTLDEIDLAYRFDLSLAYQKVYRAPSQAVCQATFSVDTTGYEVPEHVDCEAVINQPRPVVVKMVRRESVYHKKGRETQGVIEGVGGDGVAWRLETGDALSFLSHLIIIADETGIG